MEEGEGVPFFDERFDCREAGSDVVVSEIRGWPCGRMEGPGALTGNSCPDSIGCGFSTIGHRIYNMCLGGLLVSKVEYGRQGVFDPSQGADLARELLLSLAERTANVSLILQCNVGVIAGYHLLVTDLVNKRI